MLEDLLVTALGDARRKAETAMQEKMQALTGGLGLPPGLGRLDMACRCRSRNRTSDPAAGAAAGAGPALGAARGAASDQAARSADDAADRRAQVAIDKIQAARFAAISIPKTLHGLHRSAARSLDHRGGRGRRRSLGAGARACDQRTLSRTRRHAVAARRRRAAGSDHRCAGARAHDPRVSEIILALNATVDGQTTAHYITDLLQEANVKVTRLAHGVPVGGELDYLDEGTLSAAMRQRTLFRPGRNKRT